MKRFLLGMLCLVSFSIFSQDLQSMKSIYLEINLNETSGGSPIAMFRRTQSVKPLEVFTVIEKAANDKNVCGIILNISSFYADRSYMWELREALVKFKNSASSSNNKKIIAFISNADTDTYCLASAADRIVMDELGTLNIIGYSVNRGYAKNALDKLGIGVREMRYFEYKSAAETFTRDSMSDADRRQYNDYLDDIFNLTRDTLKVARNLTDVEIDGIINGDFLYSAKNALNGKLVDHIGRKDALIKAIEDIEGKKSENIDKRFALYGDSASSLTNSNTVYSPPKAGGLFKRPPIIAVVTADGQTDMTGGMAALNLSETIRDLAEKSRVKAIVVRINSPGGSAEAADYLAEAIRYAKEKKPVVVSMGEVAASGGYWAAIYASHIMASPYTITGSIGVIASWFYDNGLNSKLGINTDTLQRGAHADLLTGIILPNRDLTDQEEDRYKSYILDIYNVFVNKAAAGRNIDAEKVETLAQGRIYSGTRAFDAGLIDSIGGFNDALLKARALAEIPEDKTVRYDEYPKPKFFDRILDNFIMSRGGTESFLTDLFMPLGDIRYRLEKNGKAMPLLPMEFMVR